MSDPSAYGDLTAWLLRGERGVSSNAIADTLTHGESRRHAGDYPRDPDDFRRCELLLRAVPAMRADLHRMATQGPEWAALVEHWDEVVAMLEAELPAIFAPRSYGRAHRTYAYMQKLFGRALTFPGVDDRVTIGRRGRTVWTVTAARCDSHGTPDVLILRSDRNTLRRVMGADITDLRKVLT